VALENDAVRTPRPQSVVAAVVIASGLAAFVLLAGLAEAVGQILGASRAESGLARPGWMQDHDALVSVAQVVLGALTGGCAYGLFHGRRWAGLATQGAMGLWLVQFAAIGAWMASWPPFGGRLPPGALGGDAVWGGLVLGNTIAFSTAPLAVIWIAGRRSVREWCGHGRGRPTRG
jgi:hypothetical protein